MIISRRFLLGWSLLLVGVLAGGCNEASSSAANEPAPTVQVIITQPEAEATPTPLPPTLPPPSPTPEPPAATTPAPTLEPPTATAPPTTVAAAEPAVAAEANATLPSPELFEVEWNDRSIFQTGLIQSEQHVLNELPGATIYHLDLNMADNLVDLQGRQEVLYTNRETEPLTEVYFHLFPNLLGGSLTLSHLAVNDQAVEPVYEQANSVLRVQLPAALQPGEQTVIKLDFTLGVPSSGGNNYGIFAFMDEVLALAHFYPMVSVYDDEGWNIEPPSRNGDIVYAETSFFRVRVTAPAAQTLVASGIEIDREQIDEGRQQVIFAAGPMRDFYLVSSETYTATSRTVGEITLNNYVPEELAAGAEAALDAAEISLESFNTRFGPYPYTEFDIVSTTNFALGVEYPGIVVILGDLYNAQGTVRGQSASALLEGVVAHEVGHQWFYGVVGNDQLDEPWLDEGMAQYATLIYYEDAYGPDAAGGFRQSLERRWHAIDQFDVPIGQPVEAYSPQEYSAIVYGRGPLFIVALAEEMGEEAFDAFIKDYYQTYKWGIATSADFKALAEQHCACDLASLFEEWVGK